MVNFNDFAYYAFVNANTRFLFMIPANFEVRDGMYRIAMTTTPSGQVVVNKQAGTSIFANINALEQVVAKATVKWIIGDSQAAFYSDDTRASDFYFEHNIQFVPSKRLQLNSFNRKDDPYHSTLAIIGRVVRTLRDLAYNVKSYTASRGGERVTDVGPDIMPELVRQYNKSSHLTLTKFGPGFLISPEMCQNDANLEFAVMRGLSQANFMITREPGFLVPIGSTVSVYSTTTNLDKRRSSVYPEFYKVEDYEEAKYTVVGMKSGNRLLVPRWNLINCGRVVN
jgi:hypothetical protein